MEVSHAVGRKILDGGRDCMLPIESNKVKECIQELVYDPCVEEEVDANIEEEGGEVRVSRGFLSFFLISKKIILKNTREQRQHKGYREGNRKKKEKKRKKQKHKKNNKD